MTKSNLNVTDKMVYNKLKKINDMLDAYFEEVSCDYEDPELMEIINNVSDLQNMLRRKINAGDK